LEKRDSAVLESWAAALLVVRGAFADGIGIDTPPDPLPLDMMLVLPVYWCCIYVYSKTGMGL